MEDELDSANQAHTVEEPTAEEPTAKVSTVVARTLISQALVFQSTTCKAKVIWELCTTTTITMIDKRTVKTTSRTSTVSTPYRKLLGNLS